MKLPTLAIKNDKFIIIIVLLSILTGLLAFFTMPRAEDPMMEAPFYTIVIAYPGVGPQDMEELVVDPLEDELNELDDIKYIRTEIKEGLATIRVEAYYTVDIDDKYRDILAAVNAVKPELPNDIYRIDVNRFNPLDVIILQLALVSETASYRALEHTAENIEDRLKTISGVREVKIHALPEKQIRIALDIPKMTHQGIALNPLMHTLQTNNANIPAGDISAGNKSYTLKTSGGYKTLNEIQNTVVKSAQGHLVFLKDIADVSFDTEDIRYMGRFNGQRAIFISVTQKEGKNVLDIDQALQTELQNIQENLSPDITLQTAFRQGPAVQARINDFFNNLLQGILGVGIVVFLFLGTRPSLIVMAVIPTAILIAIWALDISDFGLQQISIAGLVIALGLLVDNGIVVVENINRYLSTHPTNAAQRGTSEVGWAIVSATATTVLAFFPMTQLGGGTGEYLQTLPLIVIFSLIASLLLALTFTPILAHKFLKAPTRQPRMATALQTLRQTLYRPLLTTSLNRPFTIITLATICFVGSLALFPLVGISFFPTADKPLLLIDIETPEGANIDHTENVARFVENQLDTTPLVASYTTNIGHGNPQIYYNRIPKNFIKTHAQILVNLKRWEPQSFYATINQLRHTFQNYSGAHITISELKNGPPNESPIEIKILGDNLDTLKTVARDIAALISETEGTQNINNPLAIDKTDLRVNINRQKAGLLGLAIADIDLTVRAGMNGHAITRASFQDGEKYDLVVRLPIKEHATIEDLNNINVTSLMGAHIPLRQIADIHFEAGPSRLGHFNLKREATLTADVEEGRNTADVTQQIIAKLKTYNFPTHYTFYVGGEYETQQDSFGSMGQILIVALLGIFAVLVLQFKSYKQPFVVFSAIPLAFTGSIVMLFITGFSFSFFAFVGFTSLVGIVINNAIILVDYTNQRLAQNDNLIQAIQDACETRFMPIVLTTLTTIVGLLPLTLTGSNLWAPLGWTIIGGMISSTVLTLIIVPILLQWFTKPQTA